MENYSIMSQELTRQKDIVGAVFFDKESRVLGSSRIKNPEAYSRLLRSFIVWGNRVGESIYLTSPGYGNIDFEGYRLAIFVRKDIGLGIIAPPDGSLETLTRIVKGIFPEDSAGRDK